MLSSHIWSIAIEQISLLPFLHSQTYNISQIMSLHCSTFFSGLPLFLNKIQGLCHALHGPVSSAYFSYLISHHFPLPPLESHQSLAVLEMLQACSHLRTFVCAVSFVNTLSFQMASWIVSSLHSDLHQMSCYPMWKSTFITLFSLEYLLVITCHCILYCVVCLFIICHTH